MDVFLHLMLLETTEIHLESLCCPLRYCSQKWFYSSKARSIHMTQQYSGHWWTLHHCIITQLLYGSLRWKIKKVWRLSFPQKMINPLANHLTKQMWASQVALVVKNSPANAGDIGDSGSIPGSGRSSGGGHCNPTPVFLPGESHGQRSLAGYGPWGCKESDMN